MSKPITKKEEKVCKRCNSNISQDIVCPQCKNELLTAFDSKVDWQTAFEIEKVQRMASKYVNDWDD